MLILQGRDATEFARRYVLGHPLVSVDVEGRDDLLTGRRRLVTPDVDVGAAVPQVVSVLVFPVKRQTRQNTTPFLKTKTKIIFLLIGAGDSPLHFTKLEIPLSLHQGEDHHFTSLSWGHPYGVVILTETEIETDKRTEPIKWVLNPLASVTSVSVSVSVLGSVNISRSWRAPFHFSKLGITLTLLFSWGSTLTLTVMIQQARYLYSWNLPHKVTNKHLKRKDEF